MRALCESCSKPQPADWRPGDLCVHCGLQVRQQVRCYWCSHWIPAGKFCRQCGAEGITPDLYAPARMLKFYGSDMFSIPKMLREMDPDRVDTFRSIYGQHLAVAMRHVEELRELENELFSKHWSSELEEQLIPQLPWPEKEFGLYSAGDRTGRNSPFLIVANMASLVALRRGDFDLLPKIGPSLLSSSMRPDLDLEAALQISNWRVAGNTYLESLRYAAMSCLRQAEPKTLLVRISLAYLGERDVTVPDEALTSDDFEVAFFAALMLGSEPILLRALDSPDPLQWMVAANKLIRLRRTDAIVDVYRRKANPEQQLKLLGTIQLEKRPVPEMHDALFETIGQHLEVNARFNQRSKLARAAASVICFDCSRAEAMRLASTLDWEILHALSLAKAVDPETLRAIGELLVRENKVTMSEYAWTCMANPGRMPIDFVESIFPSTNTAETQTELLKFAKHQNIKLPLSFFERAFPVAATSKIQVELLDLAVDQTGMLPEEFSEKAFNLCTSPEARKTLLHSAKDPTNFFERVFPEAGTSEAKIEVFRFAERQIGKSGSRPTGTPMECLLLRAAFGDHPPEVFTEAWSALYRINMGRDSGTGRKTPFRYSVEAIERLWPLPEFETMLARLQADHVFSRSIIGSELARFRDIFPEE